MSSRERRVAPEQVVAGLVVAAAVAFVLWQLGFNLVRDTTPVQGDLGEHLLEPAHLRDHLLPHGRLAGWSQAWFLGYPAFTFYFPMGGLIPVLLDVVLPYNVAFKVAAVAGPLSLPVVAYAFGRLHGRNQSTAACYGVALLIPLLQPLLYDMGGSIGAAVLGEYAYGYALSLGLLALGLTGAGLRTGRYRALTAVVLAAAVLSHVLPVATVLVGMVLLTAMRATWNGVRWTVTVLAVAAAVAGFWLVPLAIRGKYTAGPHYERIGSLSEWLFPSEMAPILLVAFGGLAVTVFAYFAVGIARRNELELFMVTMAATSALLVAVLPEGRVQNTRWVACWFVWVALLAANAVARGAEAVDRARLRRSRGRSLDAPRRAQLVAPVLLLVALLPLWDSRLGKGLLTGNKSDARNFAAFFLEGYERGRTSDEFQGFIRTVRDLARTHGCGRLQVEWNNGTWDDHRVPLTDLTPYWTDGCITVPSGLSVQSSATSPYLGTTSERVSFDGVTLEKHEADKRPFDLPAGIADLRLLGVRYYAASDARTQKVADASPDLRFLAETAPYADRRWKIYEVPDIRIVEPLRFEPVVVPSINRSGEGWEDATRTWYNRGADREVVMAANGPDEWRRYRRPPADLPRAPVPETTIERVDIGEDRISFDTSRPGVPVLVKVSYFPNWRTKGADGPWRVTPNFMVVVPRENKVMLHYARTLPDHGGTLVSLGGIGAVGLLATRAPLDMPPPRTPPAKPVAPSRPPMRKPAKRQRR